MTTVHPPVRVAVWKNWCAKGTVGETQRPPETLGLGCSGPQHRSWKVEIFLTYMISPNQSLVFKWVMIKFCISGWQWWKKKKKKGMWCEWRGDGHTFMGVGGRTLTGVTGLTVLLWFGSQEVPRVLEFLPSKPESPFYFKAVIRDVAKNVYTGYSLHII